MRHRIDSGWSLRDALCTPANALRGSKAPAVRGTDALQARITLLEQRVAALEEFIDSLNIEEEPI